MPSWLSPIRPGLLILFAQRLFGPGASDRADHAERPDEA